MCINRHVLLVAKHKSFDNLEQICRDQNLLVTRAYNFCDMIEYLATYRYSIIFIDNQSFFVNEDIIALFKRKNYFVPFVVVLNDTPLSFNEENILTVNENNFNQIEDAVKYCQENNKSQKFLYSDSYLQKTVSKKLEELGFKPKYKGFNFLSSMVYRVLTNENSLNTLKKAVYPFVSSLYGVSEASVERDVRNLISITVKNTKDDDLLRIKLGLNKPTCKNIILLIIDEMKDLMQG